MAIRAALDNYYPISWKSLQHKTLLLSVTKKVIVKKVKLCSKACDNHEQMASHGGFPLL